MELIDFPPEILYNILLKVDYRFLLTNCALVSRNWKNIIRHNHFMISYAFEWIDCYPRNLSRSPTEIDFCHTFFTNNQKNYSIPVKAIRASSTDHLSQHIALTIAKNPNTFWSSSGTTSENDDELLVYEVGMGVSVIKVIQISFFQANWLPFSNGRIPCFSSKSIRIEIINERDEIIYRSRNFKMEHRNRPQFFILPKPLFVFEGQKINLHLLGKSERQLTDNLFYTCVNNFSLYGFSSVNFPFQYIDGIFTKYSEEEHKNLKHAISQSVKILHALATHISRIPNLISGPRMSYYLEQLGKLNPRIREPTA